MELKFSKIVDRDKKIAEMFIYGELGENYELGEINGHYLAQELNWLGKNYDEVIIRINSQGGRVSHGLSIVSEMLQSPLYITAKVDGIAASMAAVILAGADKVVMNDYARLMIHSPYYSDENGEIKKLGDKEKKALEQIKQQLIELLKKRSVDEARVNEMMKTDTWFTAEDAMKEGLIDEIVSTGKKAEMAGLDITRLVAAIKIENVNSEINTMKKVIAKLNLLGAKLTEAATEDEINLAIDAYVKPAPAEPAKAPQKLIDKLIEAGKKSGAVTEKNEASFKALAEKDVDLFCDMLDLDAVAPASAEGTTPPAGTRVSEIVSALKEAGIGQPQGTKKYTDYTEKELDDLFDKQPDKYKALYKAHFGVDYDKV